MSTISTKKPRSGSLFHSNPVLSRVSKIDERSETGAATYGGILSKTGYFLLMTFVGILAYCILSMTVFTNGGVVLRLVPNGQESLVISEVTFAVPEVILGVVCALLTIFMPFVCAFSIGATPVCGTLYCVSEGYLLSFIIFKFLGMRNIPTSIGLVALILTVLVVAVMAFLYTKRIVNANRTFYAVLMSAVGASVLGGLIVFIMSLIPATRDLVTNFMNNPVIAIGASAFSVVLAALFLISDFAVIEHCVEDHLPAKYEWMASFGLAFTVIWLYLKILELLIRILGKSNDK